MTSRWWHKSKGWLITLIIVTGLLLVMDSCMQFRMSKTEIEHFFADKPVKGTLRYYRQGKRIINYVEAGDSDKPLIIFIHGSPGSLSAFINFLADSALLHRFQLITVDRPGFGASNFGQAEPSLKKQSALLKPILELHKKQRIILVGHSLGGPVIGRMAMDYPELIHGLIFVAGSIDPDLEPHEWFRAPLATPFLKVLLPRSIRASNDEIYKLKPQLQEMLPLWTNVTTPAIFIQGQQDNLVHPNNAQFAKTKMDHASVKIIMKEDMNHFVPWTHPELIREAILEIAHTVR